MGYTKFYSGNRFIPEDKDYERAESCSSNEALEQQLSKITDPDKLCRRCIAFMTIGTYGKSMDMWIERAKELGISDADILTLKSEVISVLVQNYVVTDSGVQKVETHPSEVSATLAVAAINEEVNGRASDAQENTQLTEEVTVINSENAIKVLGEDFTNIVIPEGVTTISARTFADYKQVKSVTFPSTIQEVEKEAFVNCSNLDSVIFPREVSKLTIGSDAFSDIGRTDIKLPEGTSVIGARAFLNSGITSVNIPKSIKEIWDRAFGDCKDLKDVNFEEGGDWLREIPANCFVGCTSLEEITLPKCTKIIWDLAFNKCTNLKELTALGVEYKGEGAFRNCDNLKKVKLGQELDWWHDGVESYMDPSNYERDPTQGPFRPGKTFRPR